MFIESEYLLIIEDGIVKGDAQSPIAQRTKLDWIISGPTNGDISVTNSQGYHISVDKDLHDLLQHFWKLEETSPSSMSSLSKNEQECEQHYKLTHSRDQERRYIVKLPFK